MSFLNGAHLNPRGRLSKLFRRYCQTRAASPSNTGASSVEASPPLSSLVLSELGVNHLNKEQLSQALANCWTSLDIHSTNGGSINVCDVLKLCRGTYTLASYPGFLRDRGGERAWYTWAASTGKRTCAHTVCTRPYLLPCLSKGLGTRLIVHSILLYILIKGGLLYI